VRSLGAVAAFDYHDPDCGRKIRGYTNNTLKLVWDTISLPETAQTCAEALSSASGGKYYTILRVDSPREDVETKSTLAYYMFGETMQLREDGPPDEPDLESYENAKSFVEMANELVARDKIKPHPPRVGKDGLKGLLDGLKLMKEGKVSAAKLVYRVAETP
jgi:NADPH:quinone reductase-like Zn-dependent oxidoreductase